MMPDSAVSWVASVKPIDAGLAFTPLIHSAESLHALSAGRSASLACSSVSDMSTIAVACFERASVQADETGGDFVLEQPVMKMKLTVASITAGMILGRIIRFFLLRHLAQVFWSALVVSGWLPFIFGASGRSDCRACSCGTSGG